MPWPTRRSTGSTGTTAFGPCVRRTILLVPLGCEAGPMLAATAGGTIFGAKRPLADRIWMPRRLTITTFVMNGSVGPSRADSVAVLDVPASHGAGHLARRRAVCRPPQARAHYMQRV